MATFFFLACKKHAVHEDASKRHVERGDVSDLMLPGCITPRLVGQGSESIGQVLATRAWQHFFFFFLFGMQKTRGTWGCSKKESGEGRRVGSHVAKMYHTKSRWSRL